MRKLFLITVKVFLTSCTDQYDKDLESGYGQLTENARAFLRDISTRSDWKTELNSFTEGETFPALNEVITLVSFPRGFHYILPIINDNNIESLLLYPFECSNEGDKFFHDPVAINKNNVEGHPFSIILTNGNLFLLWESKGYTVDWLNVEPECCHSHNEIVDQPTEMVSSGYSSVQYSHRFYITCSYFGPGDPEYYFSGVANVALRFIEGYTHSGISFYLWEGYVNDEARLISSGYGTMDTHENATQALFDQILMNIEFNIYLSVWITHYGCGLPDGNVTPPGGNPNPNPKPDPNPGPEPGSGKCNCNPCLCLVDSENNKSIPLRQLELQPPSAHNIAGATFGNNVRSTGTTPKAHNGIDLYAPVGTPIYSMFEGTIVGRYVTTQPDRIGGKYPSTHQGDENDAGNRIYIQSTVNGQTIKIAYFHLQAGKPVATNKETGQPFKPGDIVPAGAIIGYVGITGNASAARPHLHLGVQDVSGRWIDPSPYINADISTSSTSININKGSRCLCANGW